MKIHRKHFAALALACTPLLAGAASTWTPQDTLEDLFDVEGNSPYPSPYGGNLTFSALASKYTSPNGHGYRNELKLTSKLRRSATQTREHFSARVTPTLPNGAKTIIAQYHVEGLDTVVKVYVQDTADNSGIDKKADNGVFDILVRMAGANDDDSDDSDSDEVATALGTVRSGERFDLDIRFTAGDAQVAVVGPDGQSRTAQAQIKAADRIVYLKFGDYLQALDPVTGKHTSDPKKWDEYYRLHHIDSSRVRFSRTVFERDADTP